MDTVAAAVAAGLVATLKHPRQEQVERVLAELDRLPRGPKRDAVAAAYRQELVTLTGRQ